jgi:hypothetical protein
LISRKVWPSKFSRAGLANNILGGPVLIRLPSKDDCATAEGRGPGRTEEETGWNLGSRGVCLKMVPFSLGQWQFSSGKYGATYIAKLVYNSNDHGNYGLWSINL